MRVHLKGLSYANRQGSRRGAEQLPPGAARTVTPELVVLSRDRAESYDPQGVEVAISITDPGAPHVTLSPQFAAVLRLEFSDILAADRPGQKPFGPEDADQIIDFVARWAHADRIVVHCVGGASRSPGVALGLCDRHGWPATAIERAKPFWNSLVRSVLAGRSGPGNDYMH